MATIFDLIPRFERSLGRSGRLFDPLFEELSRPFLPSWYTEETRGWVPPAEFTESEKAYNVTVELPGIDMKGLDISYVDGVLTLKGDKIKVTEESESCHCSERYTGSFSRSFRIPGGIKENKIDATYKDGIVKVVLPKSHESHVKKIEIH